MLLLIESEDKDSEEEDSGEGMFKTNVLAKHNMSLNSLPNKNCIQATGILAQRFHFIRKLRCFSNFSKGVNV